MWIEALFGVVPGAGSTEVNRTRRFWGGFGHLCLLGCSFGAFWAALFSPGLLWLEGLEEWVQSELPSMLSLAKGEAEVESFLASLRHRLDRREGEGEVSHSFLDGIHLSKRNNPW